MEAQVKKSTWTLDPAHSEVSFKVKHLMITNVKGDIRKFSAQVESEDDHFTKATVTAEADADSIDTNSPDRDKHLKSADFFDAEHHRTITFRGSTTRKGNSDYNLEGELTMKGVTKPVKFNVEFGGLTRDPYGNEKAGFSFTGRINRKDWGLNWNAMLETGGVMVSDEVRIEGEIQLIRNK